MSLKDILLANVAEATTVISDRTAIVSQCCSLCIENTRQQLINLSSQAITSGDVAIKPDINPSDSEFTTILNSLRTWLASQNISIVVEKYFTNDDNVCLITDLGASNGYIVMTLSWA